MWSDDAARVVCITRRRGGASTRARFREQCPSGRFDWTPSWYSLVTMEEPWRADPACADVHAHPTLPRTARIHLLLGFSRGVLQRSMPARIIRPKTWLDLLASLESSSWSVSLRRFRSPYA